MKDLIQGSELYFLLILASPYMMSSKNLTLVFTDSRGKCLDAYLDTDEIQVKYFKGCGLIDLVELADIYILNLKPTCVLFIAGVCDMTTRNRGTKNIALKFTTYGQLTDHMIGVFPEARMRTGHRYPNLRVGFGGLCGFEINRYNRWPGVSPYQRIIDDVVDSLNYVIMNNNIQHQIVHPTLTRKIHRRSWKCGFRNQYRLLYDGVHLSRIVNEDWAKNIYRYHCNHHTRSL